MPDQVQEPKARGANRSTKAAGKLKVLPEQPDLPLEVNRRIQDLDESVGTTGDSEDGDIDDDDEPEVRLMLNAAKTIEFNLDAFPGLQSNISHTAWHSSQRRAKINEEKGEIIASRHCIRHSKVRSICVQYQSQHTSPRIPLQFIPNGRPHAVPERSQRDISHQPKNDR